MNYPHYLAERAFVILSDIEMGQGGPCDDFPHDEYLAHFVLGLNQPPYDRLEVDLVFNGDTFDFLKTSCDGLFRHIVNEELALRKLELIRQAHPLFFEGLRRFLSFTGARRRVHFVAGNHDQELFFPEVQRRLTELCGGGGQIFFPGLEMRAGDLRVEHGSQKDDLFEIDPEKPFLKHNGERILNLPWASVTLLNAFIPLRDELHELDRIKPKAKVFELLPEMKEWFMARLWNYWTKDYLKEYVTFSDPLKKVGWSMIREGLKRSLFFSPDVSMGQKCLKELKERGEFKVSVTGHGHEPKVVGHGDRKLIHSGCWRDEFMMSADGERFAPIPKSYVEVLFKDNQTLCSNLVEVPGPGKDKLRLPRPLSSYRSYLQERLAEEKSKNAKQTAPG